MRDGRHRGSSSSEDNVDTSDENLELMFVDVDRVDPNVDTVVDERQFNEEEKMEVIETQPVNFEIERFIAERRRQDERDRSREDVQPSTSSARDNSQQRRQSDRAEERATELIRKAEAKKAKSMHPTGRPDLPFDIDMHGGGLAHSVLVDENYLVVAAHVDEVTQYKIEKGEYVDFSRLIPRD